ncbi:hypothetical protein [Haloechinothrix sp. LS1_15]|uniref:hypothetical protein n=1 Tax=Haloechinothrix sp. LS1_15 TaxID=2652248 RepID=UPI00294B69EB|nr:hypothetical protein [Haloechinothrix sp. LS1_15]
MTVIEAPHHWTTRPTSAEAETRIRCARVVAKVDQRMATLPHTEHPEPTWYP